MPILAKICLPPADYHSDHDAEYPAELFTTSKSSVSFTIKQCLLFWLKNSGVYDIGTINFGVDIVTITLQIWFS